MSKEQSLGIKLDFHASSYTLGSFPQNNLKNDVQYVINQTFIPDRTSTNSNSGKGNYIASIEAFRIRSAAVRNAQLLITNNFQIETTIEFTSEGLHYLYSDNTSSNVTHLNIRASTSLKTLEILYNTTLCMTFNYDFVINKKYNIIISYINSRYYLMINGIECGKSTISAAQNLNSLFQNASIFQCFYSYKYSATSVNGFIGNVYDLICSFDSKYIHRSINGYNQLNDHLLSNLSYSTGLEIERKNEPSIVWSYENVSFAPNKITYDISPMSTNIPSKDFKIEFTISDIKLGIHNIAKIDNKYFIDYTVTGVLEPDVEVNDYTTSALNFENGIIDQVSTTVWNKEGTADITNVNPLFGDKSFETKALGDSLYTNSNIITGGSTPFTIEFYVLVKGIIQPTDTQYIPIFYNHSSGSANRQGLMRHKTNGNLIYYSNFQSINIEIRKKINFNEINKMSISYDGACIRIFINDVLESTFGQLSYITQEFIKFLSGDSDTRMHTGLIDNINIFNGVATKVRDVDPYEDYLVVDLAFDGENNSTKIVDNGTLKYVWAVNGSAILSTSQPFDGFSSLYLNSNGGLISGTQPISNSDVVTISFNVIQNRLDNNVYYDTYDGNYDGGFQIIHYNGTLGIWYSNIFVSSGKVLTIGQKYSITFIYENQVSKLFVDGVLVLNKSLPINFKNKYCIGAQLIYNNSNYYSNCYLKNFKIYKGVAIIPENTSGKIQLEFDNNLNDKYSNSILTNNGVAFDNVNSVKGYSAYFDASTDYLEANVNNSYLNYASNDFNLSFDLKETNKSSSGEVFSNNIASTAAGSIWFYTGSTAAGFDYFSKPTGVTSNTQSSFVNIYYNYKLSRYKGVLLNIQNGVITNAHNVGNISFNLINGGSFRFGKPTTTFHSTVGGFIGYLDNFKSNSDHFYGKMWAMVIANVAVANSPYDYNNTSLATHKSYFPGSISHLKYSFSATPNVTINDVANSYIIEENPLGKKFFIYAANGTYTNTEAQLFLEFLDADNNVIVAMKWFRDTTYSNMFTYGPTLSSQINTTKVGAYGITNGILAVNSNGLLFTNLSTATANYIDNFSYSINLSNIKKYRISGMKAVGDYNPTQPGVRIQEVIDNGSFEPIVDKPGVHFPLESNATNIGFANLTVTSTGNPTYTTIDNKKCIKFESGKYLTITSNNIFNLSNNSDFYIELDFYLLTDKYHVLFSNASSSTSGLCTITAASSTHTQPNVIYIYQNNATNIKTSNSWIMNSWNNLIISRNGGIITLILNGVVTTINSSVPLDYSTSGTRIGQPSYDANAFVDGYMSNFKMFIGSSKISETYNDKKVLDLDFAPTRESYMFKDKNNKCVLHPINIAQRDFKNSQYCCTFNGSDQYIELGKNDLFNFGLDDFIFEFKFTPVADGTWNILIGNGSTASDSNYSYIGISESTNATNPSKVYLTIGGALIALISSNQVSYNSINTLIVSKNNSDYQIILNGIVTTGNYTPTALNFNYNNSTRIGSTQVSNWVNHLFSGQIYSVKVLRNTSNIDMLNESSGSSYDISLYDSTTNESSNIIVDKINDKNILKRIGNELSYSSGSNIINLNVEEKTEESTDIVLFDTFKGSIKNDIKVYDGDYNIDAAEFVNNPIVYDYVDIEIAEDEYCESRSFELGDYIIKGFIEGYRNHNYQIIQTNNNFVVSYGNDDFYYEGIEKRFLNDYIVLDVETGIRHKIYDRVMVRGQLTINIQQLACEGSDYVLKLYRKNDYFFIGEYEITGGICTIENLDCNTLYDCILFDRSGYYEGRTLSSRTPTPL